MIYSLWFRFLMAFAVIIVVTVGTIYLFVSQRIAVEMEYYEEISEEYDRQQTRSIHDRLKLYWWGQGGNWEEVQDVVEDITSVSGISIILTDADGLVIADSQEEHEVGEYYSPDSPGSNLTMPWSGELLGKVYITLNPEAEPYFASPQRLSASVDRSLLLGGSLAIGIALVLTFVLSRRLSSPIGVLANAARRLGRGDLSQRVQFRGKGEVGVLAQAFNSMAAD